MTWITPAQKLTWPIRPKSHQFHSSSVSTPDLIFPFSNFVLWIDFVPDTDNNGESATGEGTRTAVFVEFPTPIVKSASLSESSKSDADDLGSWRLGRSEWYREVEELEEKAVAEAGRFSLDTDNEPEETGKAIGEINADTREFCISESKSDALFWFLAKLPLSKTKNR